MPENGQTTNHNTAQQGAKHTKPRKQGPVLLLPPPPGPATPLMPASPASGDSDYIKAQPPTLPVTFLDSYFWSWHCPPSPGTLIFPFPPSFPARPSSTLYPLFRLSLFSLRFIPKGLLVQATCRESLSKPSANTTDTLLQYI